MAIGPFRILDTLGEGGMGTVYLTQQREPIRRRVAMLMIHSYVRNQEMHKIRITALHFAASLTATIAAQNGVKVVSDRVPIQWQEVKRAPDWVAMPPARSGFLRYVTSSRSNVAAIAQKGASRRTMNQARDQVTDVLMPVLGRELAVGVAASVQGPKALKHAHKPEPPVKVRVPGNPLATAWVLWEIPIRPVVDAAPVARRGQVERAFLRQPPPWEKLRKKPAWFRRPGARKGWYRIALTHEGRWQRDTRHQALVRAAAEIRAALIARLEPVIGARAAKQAAAAAVRDFHPVRRGLWFRRRPEPQRGDRHRRTIATTVWVVWEVSVARMQRAVGRWLAEPLAQALQR